MTARIGFVEDDDVIRENYSDLLREEGYDVLTASNSASALTTFSSNSVDLMILDVSLGSEHDAGFQLCSVFRQQNKDLPIIFLTSHDSEIDHISGLRVGADDYLSKGTSFAFLLVRIQTLLRRVSELGQNKNNTVQPEKRLFVDTETLTVKWKGQRVDLPLTQYWIVRALVESKSTCDLNQLMKAANIFVEPNTVAAHIKNIRSKFRALDPEFSSIKTERGRGYRWLD